MSEIFNFNLEIDKGPKGPIFYLIENIDGRVELANYLEETVDFPSLIIHRYPKGEEHSEIVVHEICIKYAKDGKKEEVVEDNTEMLERYSKASGVLRKGGIILQVNRCGIFDVDQQFIKDLNELFPQSK